MRFILPIIVLLVGLVAFFQFFATSYIEREKMIVITEEVNNFRKLANKLEEEGVIKHPEIFYYSARVLLNNGVIYPGEYRVDSSTNLLTSLFLFTDYKNIHSYIVTIPEGSNSRQVLRILKNNDSLQGNLPNTIKEGILMPDTYRFQSGTEYEQILARMEKEQVAFLDKAWEERARDLPITTKREAIILASLIEEETGIKGERAKIAGVFVNRLRAGMRLQSDPTVAYGLGKDSANGLKKSELRSQTPYNTYVVRGLPVGPISNPGRAAILAALNPEKHNLYYFVADGSGGHVFSQTLAEHNRNVQNWRIVEQKIRERQQQEATSK